uniref:NADH dehydrogenase subunit 6 n=1 Tax=Porcellionides pruinosus TaxID=96870 RepID=A0A1P8DKJ1_PORPN|nr:NADH dehydrogenase subunit 6 [Porcellionides pruinosus]
MNYSRILVSKTNILFKLIFDLGVVLGVLCLSVSVSVTVICSPQLMVMWLILQAFMVSIMLGFMSGVWYAYVLFLVFLGGMLVVFVYISSLAMSVKVDSKYLTFGGLLAGALILGVVLGFWSPWSVLASGDLLLASEGSGVSGLTSTYVVMLYLFVVGYLMLTLFIICSMVKLMNGPLRKFSFSCSYKSSCFENIW